MGIWVGEIDIGKWTWGYGHGARSWGHGHGDIGNINVSQPQGLF
jgi:hypothetical protein